MREPIEQQVVEILDAAQGIPEPAPERRAQAVAAMEAAGARAVKQTPRWRVAVAAITVVGLIGLGFIPLPRRAEKGALDRALAAASQARTMHAVTVRGFGEGATPRSTREKWMTEAGFQREVSRLDGRITNQTLIDGPWMTDYRPGVAGQPGSATIRYVPCFLHPPAMPSRGEFMRENVGLYQYLRGQHLPHGLMTVREYRTGSLLGGNVVVVEIEKVITHQRPSRSNPTGKILKKELLRAEIDPDTNALLSERQYTVSGGQQRLVEETTYDWNVVVPEELRHLDLPKGTKIVRDDKWETKAQQVVAKADTPSWHVTLHAVDVQTNGDLRVWVSRVNTPKARGTFFYSTPGPRVNAVGSRGERYTQDKRSAGVNTLYVGYWITPLHPGNVDSRPTRLTLTIWPYPEYPSRNESVTFRNVLVPAQ